MKRTLLLTFALALTACAAQPVVAPTATVTLPPTSTLAPTETPIPSATATATPLPVPADIAAQFNGTGFEPYMTPEGMILLRDATTGLQVPELNIDPTTKEIVRTYAFDNPAGGQETVIVKYTKEELTARNFSAWEIKDGNWVRKHVVHEGVETDIPLYSMAETIRVILSETKKIEDANGGVLPKNYSSIRRWCMKTLKSLTKKA